MIEIYLKDLDPRRKKQLDNAEKAIGKNPHYAIDVCTDILSRNPGCVDVRKILRKAQQHTKHQKTSGLYKFWGKLTQAPLLVKAARWVSKDPQLAMEAAEKLITINPANGTAHRLVGQAAEALQLWNTASFAYGCWAEVEPANTQAVVAMGNTLMQAGRPREAIAACDRVLMNNPSHQAAQDIVRRAAVAETMEQGKWREGGDFREKLANEDNAVALKYKARAINDKASLQSHIALSIGQLETEPHNLKIYRDIIGNYRRLEDFEHAMEYLDKARALWDGKSDPTLERLAIDVQLQQMSHEIKTKEAAFASDPNNAQLKAEIAVLEKKAHTFQLDNAHALVERYPHDCAARFELGKVMFIAGQLDPAIQQFQLAQKNPKVRVHAMLYLGRTYLAKKFYDLAAEQLAIAKSELMSMSDLKKEVIYELASAYEQMEEHSKAIAEFKVIYANDIGYLDVADKINAYYEHISSTAL